MDRAQQDHTELNAIHTCDGRAKPGNLHPQSSTAVTHCLLIAAHFIDPRKDDSLCQARVPPGVKLGQVASEASVLPRSHLLHSSIHDGKRLFCVIYDFVISSLLSLHVS